MEHRKHARLLLCAGGCLSAIILLDGTLPTFWSSTALAQQSVKPNFSRQAQAAPRRGAKPSSVAQPPRATPSPTDPGSSPPAADPESVLGSALASCDKTEGREPVSLPGAKGEIKLDRCYRGRDRLVCSFRALLSEAKFLTANFRNTV